MSASYTRTITDLNKLKTSKPKKEKKKKEKKTRKQAKPTTTSLFAVAKQTCIYICIHTQLIPHNLYIIHAGPLTCTYTNKFIHPKMSRTRTMILNNNNNNNNNNDDDDDDTCIANTLNPYMICKAPSTMHETMQQYTT